MIELLRHPMVDRDRERIGGPFMVILARWFDGSVLVRWLEENVEDKGITFVLGRISTEEEIVFCPGAVTVELLSDDPDGIQFGPTEFDKKTLGMTLKWTTQDDARWLWFMQETTPNELWGYYRPRRVAYPSSQSEAGELLFDPEPWNLLSETSPPWWSQERFSEWATAMLGGP